VVDTKQPVADRPPPPTTPPAEPPPSAGEMSKLEQMCKAQRSGLGGRLAGIASDVASKVGSSLDVTAKCMCYRGNQAAAQKAFDQVSINDRPPIRRACARYGIKLRE
jgi:hypothetical protein